MKKLAPFVLAFSIIGFCYSCYYDTFLELDIPIDEIVSYSNDIQPIFTASCISCHDGMTADPDLREGSSYNMLVPQYVTAFESENSSLIDNLPGNNHPVDIGFSLSDEDIALIEAWIDQGAEDN
ncbi:MAG: cytochrome c [Bacteroidia bacterium]|nr:cytochrome c [Bacteroidia bacterium]NND51039.1 hypothetical protein [Flavobacteriaceae bacterium]